MDPCQKALARAQKLVERKLSDLDIEIEDRGGMLYFEVSFKGRDPPKEEEEEEMLYIEQRVVPVLKELTSWGLRARALWDWCCGFWNLGVEVWCP